VGQVTTGKLVQLLQLYLVMPLPRVRSIWFLSGGDDDDHDEFIARAVDNHTHLVGTQTRQMRDGLYSAVCADTSPLPDASLAHLGIGFPLEIEATHTLRRILDLFSGGIQHLCVWPDPNVNGFLLYLMTCGVPYVSFSDGTNIMVTMTMLVEELHKANAISTLRGVSIHCSLHEVGTTNSVSQQLRGIADDALFPRLEHIAVRRGEGVQPFQPDSGFDEPDEKDFFDVSYDDQLLLAAREAMRRRTVRRCQWQKKLAYLMLAARRANRTHELRNSMISPLMETVLKFAQDGPLVLPGAAELDFDDCSETFDDLYWLPFHMRWPLDKEEEGKEPLVAYKNIAPVAIKLACDYSTAQVEYARAAAATVPAPAVKRKALSK